MIRHRCYNAGDSRWIWLPRPVNEILVNLVEMLGQAGWPQLRQTPLLVISERMREQAHEIGFENILLAQNASYLQHRRTALRLGRIKQKGDTNIGITK